MRRKNKLFISFGTFIIVMILGLSSSVLSQNSQQKMYDKERGILTKNFGIILPDSIENSQKYKLKDSGVTYLLIKMSKKDGELFISATKRSSRPRGVLSEIQDESCGKNKNCPAIGSIFSPSDEPDEIIEHWKKENNFDFDTVATFNLVKNKQLKNYASFYLDTKKGLLMLWYKK